MRCLFTLVLPLLVLTTGCSFKDNLPQSVPTPARIEKIDTRYLPNAVRIHDQVISGGLPDGEAGFAELQELGIRTVISVDGAKPDVVTAQMHGLRYVHLPHGYDGVPEERAKELAKAVRDLPGPIYIHCHHGHHRSPAAAAVACVGAGLIAHHEAALVLQVAGTSEHYRGLFESAQSAHAFEKALLDELQCEFPATATLPPLAEAMVLIEQTHDHLQTLQRVDWRVSEQQPALVAEHEALLLREHFTELLRTSDVQQRPAAFRQLMVEGESAARALEESLQIAPRDPAAATELLAKVSRNCQSCHQAFRDVPLGK
jgi:protein tyrosine phosphatase (PTP) superfamily phosphohydrolase (DUF442 family)